MKVVDTFTLKKMIATARMKRFNRTVHTGVMKMLDPAGRHVLSQPIIHNDVQNVRCLCCLLKLVGRDEPLEVVLDFDIDQYNRLQDYEEPATDRTFPQPKERV